ncbi:MAG: hypothetical protein IT378_20390, partial [Sandaracinaceae bacterium]|nr:hypothetical protein [Sandaracinaceae bacterium]
AMRTTSKAALVALLLLAASAASATTFDDITVEELTRASDLVVLGRVERVDVFVQGPGGQPGIHTRATIRVEETWRGEAQDIVEVWAHGGVLGDRMRVVPGQATFRVGERAVLFLFRAGGGLWPTGMGRGKWILGPSGSLQIPSTVTGGPTSPLGARRAVEVFR